MNFAAYGPLAGLYKNISGPVIDALFMFGLFGLGTALVLGIGLRIAGIAAPLLMLLLWSARIPPENNPPIDEHIIYALTIASLSALKAGETWGLGAWWKTKVPSILE